MRDEVVAVIKRRSLVTGHRSRFFAMALAVIAMAGCDYLPFGYVHVKDIVAAPAKFEGKEIKLKGRVRNVTRVPGIKAYTLREETGEIIVVTEGDLPAQNAEVALRGVVKSAVILSGAWTVGLRVEETKRLR